MLGVFLALLTWGQVPFPAPVTVEPKASVAGTVLELRTYTQPRPLRIWRLAVDLQDPDLAQTVSKPAPVGKRMTVAGKELPAETLSQTTLDFAQTEQLDIAINASPFAPVVKLSGQPLDIIGLHLRDHLMVSPALNNLACWTLSADHRLRFFQGIPSTTSINQSLLGLGGFGMALADGRVMERAGKADPLHPRTALGLMKKASGAGQSMVWLVVDGRQPGISEGLTMSELGQLGMQLGLSDLLNLDGGGSTTLVTRHGLPEDAEKMRPKVRNRPVGLGNIPGTLRPNGNNWGLWRVVAGDGVPAAMLKSLHPWLTPYQLLRLTGPLNNTLRRLDLRQTDSQAAFLALLALPGGPLAERGELLASAKWLPVQSGLAGLATELGLSGAEMADLATQVDGQVLAAAWWWQSSNGRQALRDGTLPQTLNLTEAETANWDRARSRALEALQGKAKPGG